MRALPATALSALLVSGCSVFGYEHREALGTVELYPAQASSFQLRIPYRVSGRGNVHDPFDYDKREYVWADWILLTNAGEVAAGNPFIRPCAEGHEKPYSGRNDVRGTVRLSANSAEVALQVSAGVSRDGTSAWEDYEHNGTYILVRPEHMPTEAQPISRAECLP